MLLSRNEWRAFHAAITAGAPVATTVADAMEDLTLFSAMMAVV
jgi:hypothetical protein